MLVEAYGEHALGKSQCFEWFKKFRSGNFDVRNEERVWWDQKGVIYYELLKPGETVNTERGFIFTYLIKVVIEKRKARDKTDTQQEDQRTKSQEL